MDLTTSYAQTIRADVLDRYSWLEVRNATAVIAASDPDSLKELQTVLETFHVTVPHLLEPGGGKSRLAADLDEMFRMLGWRETHMEIRTETRVEKRPWTKIGEKNPVVRTAIVAGDTHKVDNVQRRIAIDVEWNAKDGNLDRDLSAFRALFDAGVIDAGVIITRSFVEMYYIANWLAHELGRVNYDKIGKEVPRLATTTTTNMEKLDWRLRRGDAGGCPILAVGIGYATYEPGLTYTGPNGEELIAPQVPTMPSDVAETLSSAVDDEGG